MPNYQENITYRGGFYNNKVVNGVNTRVYSAEDMRKPYDVVFSDGIMPAADGTAGDTLKVEAIGGMKIAISEGFAKLGGAWFENTGKFTIGLDTASGSTRYDCVIIRNDDNEDVKAPNIYIKSLSAPPTIKDLTRAGGIYEICVAYARIAAFSASISEIVDTREDGELCSVMSGVGATVVRVYRNTYFSQTVGQTSIPIGISQYNKSRDDLSVIINGRVMSDVEGANYTIRDNGYIDLTLGLPVVGTRIDFEVRKNVNAAGAETVVQEVEELRKEMTAANRKLENIYYCNGVNDNINISNIIKSFLSKDFYHSLRLKVVGRFGFTSMASGTGATSNPYKLFDFGTFTNIPKPRAVIDFSNCDEISVPIDSGNYTCIFGGTSIEVVGVNIYAENTAANTTIRIFDNSAKKIKADDCRFIVSGYKNSLIAITGTFTNCYGNVANVMENSYCFLPANNGVVKVIGGEYYAYCVSDYNSAILGQSDADAVSILYGANAPTVSRSGFIQTYSLLQFVGGGVLKCSDLISTLPMNVYTGISEIRGNIAKNKPNMM